MTWKSLKDCREFYQKRRISNVRREMPQRPEAVSVMGIASANLEVLKLTLTYLSNVLFVPETARS